MEKRAYGFDPLESVMLIGQVAIDHHLEAGGECIPVTHVLDGTHQSLTKHSRGPGDWTRKNIVLYGHWLLGVAQDGDTQKGIGAPELRRMAQAGLGPNLASIEWHFGRKVSNYQRTIGSPVTHPRGRYRDWQTEDYLKYAHDLQRKVTAAEGSERKLTEADFRLAYSNREGPSLTMITRQIGINKINESLGYPNITDWLHGEFIEWGVQVFRANGDIKNLKSALDILSKRGRGPSETTIVRKFRSLSGFRREVTVELEHQEAGRTHRLAICQELVAQGQIPELEPTETEDQLLAIGARHRMIKYYTNDLQDNHYSRLMAIQDGTVFFRALASRCSTQITAGEVECVANQLGVYDDIVGQNTSYLKLD